VSGPWLISCAFRSAPASRGRASPHKTKVHQTKVHYPAELSGLMCGMIATSHVENRAVAQMRMTPSEKTSEASGVRERDLFSLREAIPFWFAISSPLTGLILGLLGAWVVTWLTS
jgi:hypothetical protein